MTPMKAIRAKCLECCAGSWFEVKNCEIDDCALFLYRFGHRPKKITSGGRKKSNALPTPLQIATNIRLGGG